VSCERLAPGLIVCNRGGRRFKCHLNGCGRLAEALCDHELEPYQRGKRRRTCSARICDRHRWRHGTKDLCPLHAEGTTATLARQLDLFGRPA
jgi:hypothetical protein